MARLANLPAVGVEAGEDDRPWGIVDDQLDPGRGLQGTDVATLASDDAALQVVARQVDHRNRGLDGVVGGAALDRLCDDVLRLVGGCLARFVLQPLDQVGGIAPRVRFELSDKQVLCLVGGHAGDALELGLGLLGQLLATRLLRLGRRFALENGIFASPELPRCPIHSRAAFGECTLAVVQLAFERSQLLAALARMILGLVPEVLSLLACREFRFLASGADFTFGVPQQVLRFVASAAHRLGGDPSACGKPQDEDDQPDDGGREAGGGIRKELHARLARSRRGMPGRETQPEEPPRLPCGEVV